MAEHKQYLDITGLAYLWDKITSLFVQKDGSKGLSDNNYSDAEKEKLAGLHNYSLPQATDSVLGGVKVGTGLHVDGYGRLHSDGASWDSLVNHPTTLAGYGIVDGATKGDIQQVNASISNVNTSIGETNGRIAEIDSDIDSIGTDISNIMEEIANDDVMELLEEDNLPGTSQQIVFAQNGNISQILHKRGQNTVRTDTFTFGTNTITETRALATGQTLTIVTNTETLVTTTTYAETQAGG